MRTLVLGLALAVLLAGCAAPVPEVLTLDGSDNATPSNGSAPASPAANGSKPPTKPAPGDAENGTSPPPGPPPAAWPDVASAKVRPGVQVSSDAGQCTSNFVFTSPDNASVYLGLAGHCLHGLEVGSPVDVANGAAKGTVAYSSWFITGHNEPNSPDGDLCTDEKDATVCAYNDFALVLIDPADRGLVHPAMLHFGGPVGLANASEAATGDKVLTYGNSGLRMGLEPSGWHEGVVLFNDATWTTTIYTATPGVPGDSGSGVLTGDGRALGVLVTIGALPYPGSNGVSHLDTLLAWAKEHGDVDVRLATWDLLDPGLLPL